MKTTTETHKFKKGQKLDLDEVYDIQGVANGDWMVADDDFANGGNGERVTITRDIKIKITVTQ